MTKRKPTKKPSKPLAAVTPADASKTATESLVAAPEPGPPADWWSADPRREKALDRILAGWTKKQIATDLGVHPNTVSNWCNAPEFTSRLDELRNDRENTYRQRRVHETNMLTDRVVKLANQALDRVEKYPNDYHSRQNARDWLAEYRGFREQERIDMGDNVQRHAHHVSGAVAHHHAHTLSQASFRGFLENALADGAIDVEAIETTGDVHALLTQVTQSALLETSLLDDLAEEERELARDPVLAQAERK